MSGQTVEAPEWLRRPDRGFLTADETAWLDAIFARLLPADHARQIPGAVEAGAAEFVSLLLARSDAVYLEIPAWRVLYRSALAALERHARSTYSRALGELDDNQMNQILAGLEQGQLTALGDGIDPKILFTTLRRHCLQGCFADPRWGGNRDGVMWRALGYLTPALDLYHG